MTNINGSRKISYQIDAMIGNIKYGELECKPPTVSMDSELESSDTGVKYSSTIETTGYIWQGGKETSEIFDWAKYQYKIWLIENGKKKSLGIFYPQTIQASTEGQTIYEITGYDKLILAKNDCITARHFIAKGANYINEISSLLVSCGITHIISDVSDAVVASDRDDWEVGTSKLTIINQLLSEISFKSVEVNRDGSAILSSYKEASAENIQHTYRQGQASIVKPSTTINSNIFDIPNIWAATVENPDLNEIYTYTWINDNPLSRTSTIYTGQNKVKTLSFNNIASQADLEAAVKKQAFDDMRGYDTIQYQTAIAADHGVNDIVALELPQFNGILTETAWEINFQNKNMTHKGKKTVNY